VAPNWSPPVASCKGLALAMTTSPIPSPEADLPAVAAVSTRQSALALLLRQGEATASDLADRLDVSVQAMRRHLRGLEEEGLVASSPAAEGPGRPSNRWHLTAAGRGQFTDGGQQFALGLLASIAGNLPAETVEQLMAQQALQTAASYRTLIGEGPLSERIERLVDLRRREGYVAECSQDQDKQAWLFSEFHCSVMRIAEQFPCVCDQELQLIRSTFPDCQVDRVHWRLEQGHSCGFRLCPIPQP
jgi:DeoR family transcriptional regulator, suf operon transcriptional repressor